MKKNIYFFIIILFYQSFTAQTLKFETLLNDKISIRALQIYKGKVWYSGTDSKFGFVDLKDSKNQKQIKLSDKNLQFRTLAQNKTDFYTINIESPAYFFKIDKKTLNSKIIYTDTLKTAFYDALHFVSKNSAFAFSDSDNSKRLKLTIFNNGKWLPFQNSIILNDGEAAFAASNTNIASSEKYTWIATGGKTSRIIRIDLKSNKFEVFKTPFIQGTSSTGMYSIDFLNDKFGIAVGGDYTKQADNINNIETTNDGGETWQIQASGKNPGYMTCVKIRPGSKGKDIIAVGDQNISYSSDFGKTWTKISDEKNLYVVDWVNENQLVFAGKDRILKAEFLK
jgi:hypothetical protein